MNRHKYLFLILVLTSLHSRGQEIHQDSLNRKRLRSFVICTSAVYGLTLVGLNELWYSNSPRQSFQFFNDNKEWKQVDKLGHFYSSFYLSNTTYKALRWSGVEEKKSILIGTVTGFTMLLPIEVFDGFSEAYGASAGDLAANAIGAGLFLAQMSLWDELRIRPKFSYHPTDFARKRPGILGETSLSRLFKDYNGQTYWLSFDTDKFTNFPKWLNFAIGYGAHEMVYARDQANELAGFNSYRQFYIGIDLDLSAIHTRSGFVKGLLHALSLVKLPAPAVEFSSKRTSFSFFSF